MQVVVLVTAVMGDHLKNPLEIEKMKLAYVASLTVSVMMCASAAMAQSVIVDGTCDAGYGNPKAAQSVHTGFGNATDGVNSFANGSELDAGYAKIDMDNGFLYLFLAGNLESNFNKLDVFIDSDTTGGQNEIRSDNADIDYNGLNKMGRGPALDANGAPILDGDGNPVVYAGLKFDTGFAADFCLMTTIGGSPEVVQYANIAQMLTDGGGAGGYLGNGAFSGPTGVNLIDDQVYGCQLSISNANIGGVSGDSANPGSGCGVITGIEMRIPLALLAWDGVSDIKICAFINGNGHDYVSNQVLGSLPVGSGNLGGDGVGGYLGGFPGALRGVDFAAIDGDQFFSATGPDVCGSVCLGDLNDDKVVDSSDMGSLLGSFGPCDPGTPGDFNEDLVIDSADLGSMLGVFGACP